MLTQEDFTMCRDVSPQEIVQASKPISKWEVLFWVALLVAMAMGEYVIVNMGLK